MKQNKYLIIGTCAISIFFSSYKREIIVTTQSSCTQVSIADQAATRDDNMALGNPSKATNSVTDMNNYLMQKIDYTLSYNNSKGTANWVSWHLSTAWRGGAPRKNIFATDKSLPPNFLKVTPASYKKTGFDKGHMCPSNDRDGSARDNRETFLMTNMVPQAPNNNRKTWVSLEKYCQTLAQEGNEMYIIAGPSETGGEGEKGIASALAKDKVNVPKKVWKVILVLKNGDNDITRITSSTRVIAVVMPNTQSVNANSWDYYRVSVDQIEELTGYDFFSALPASVEDVIESKKDTVTVK